MRRSNVVARRALAVALLVCMWSAVLPSSFASASVILSKCGAGVHIAGGKCAVFITASPGSLLSWTVPYDWNNNNNSVETIGAGGSGSTAAQGWQSSGGGGGAWNKQTNVLLTPGTSVNYEIGTGGASVTTSVSAHIAGNAGGDTWFCNSTSNCASISGTAVKVGSKGGSGGPNDGSSGAGGVGSSGVGGSNNNGGASGTSGAFSGSSSGGGGAGGSKGAGNASNNVVSQQSSSGGAGDNGSGGSGGTNSAGGSGTG
jgi:hypothetical protein